MDVAIGFGRPYDLSWSLQKDRSCEYMRVCHPLGLWHPVIHAGTHECHTVAVGIVECEVSATRSKDNSTAGCAVDTSAHASQAALPRMLLSQGVAWLRWSVIDAHVRTHIVLLCCFVLAAACGYLYSARIWGLSARRWVALRSFAFMEPCKMCLCAGSSVCPWHRMPFDHFDCWIDIFFSWSDS